MRRCLCHRSFRTFTLVTIVFYNTFAISRSCSSSAFIDALPPLLKDSTDSTASKTYNAIKMVRFLSFIVALFTLGITAGAPLPSNPEGEYTTLPVHVRKEDCRIVASPSGLRVPGVYFLNGELQPLQAKNANRFCLIFSPSVSNRYRSDAD